MENVTIKNEKAEILNNKITLDNRNYLSITGVSKMIACNDTIITMLIKTTKLTVSGKDLKVEKLDIDNGVLEATGTIDSIKYNGSNDGLLKRIFKWKIY